jgi:hypothetical protein
MAATTETTDKVDVLIWDDHRITSKLCAAIRNAKLANIRELGYRNFVQSG